MVARGTARADELTLAEYVAGGVQLRATVARFAPRWLAVLGVGAYRTAFARPKAVVGEQPERLGVTRRLGAAQPERPERGVDYAQTNGGVRGAAEDGIRRTGQVT